MQAMKLVLHRNNVTLGALSVESLSSSKNATHPVFLLIVGFRESLGKRHAVVTPRALKRRTML